MVCAPRTACRSATGRHGSTGQCQDPGTRVQGQEDGRSHGRGPRDHAEPAGRPDRCRPWPDHGQGRGSRLQGWLGHDQGRGEEAGSRERDPARRAEIRGCGSCRKAAEAAAAAAAAEAEAEAKRLADEQAAAEEAALQAAEADIASDKAGDAGEGAAEKKDGEE